MRELVKLPVSQLNGCVFCVDTHVGPPPILILAHDGRFVTAEPQNVPFGFGEGFPCPTTVAGPAPLVDPAHTRTRQRQSEIDHTKGAPPNLFPAPP
ncbi:hypothetical protein [Streptomyces sp. NPDC002133]|uniref:carboxymuconolactone decarboxylase family protein n=1 Tax=Streptomyces sp. NPDC002133 TaxID=3154409 RepID=UPI0033270F72